MLNQGPYTTSSPWKIGRAFPKAGSQDLCGFYGPTVSFFLVLEQGVSQTIGGFQNVQKVIILQAVLCGQLTSSCKQLQV